MRVIDDNNFQTCYTKFYSKPLLILILHLPPPPLHCDKEFAALVVMKWHENPLWFHHPKVCYCDGLQCLPAWVLTSSARRYIRKKDDVRTKTDAISILSTEFIWWCAGLSIVSDDVLFAQLSHVSLPDGCDMSQGTVLAAYLCETFGDQIADHLYSTLYKPNKACTQMLHLSLVRLRSCLPCTSKSTWFISKGDVLI